MDSMEDKVRALRQEVQDMSSQETAVRARISQMKQLLEDKKKKAESLAKLKQEEAALLANLT